ncbi:MBL fold metallo-hydrolase [Paludibacterium paludis]|uniref:Metallo-beta-lactamase domain-containing protein n=1 Tax=Paludibacterium paludis TaxID=1225769 RepID=A0A918UA86_9NEIS|nr:MBL fold metallo-hydrolase [Paludibacterium paludis]GGY15887.1 hypothetical protein GCM10011289_19070 [Paludibacterium paludis]
MQARIQSFFDPVTHTFSHIVFDEPGGSAAIIDPVLDYCPASGRIRHDSAERLAAFIGQERLHVEWLLETHVHADHLSAGAWLKQRVGGRLGIGARVVEVIRIFNRVYNTAGEIPEDGSQFDHLFRDGETFPIGALAATALSVPGHTPADMAFRTGNDVFIGDTLFSPESGSARCDFPGGDAAILYQSARRLLSLGDTVRLHLCHDYPANGAEPVPCHFAGEQRAHNIHLNDAIGEREFVALRETRDGQLGVPALMIPSIQVNLRGGALPRPENNGVRYLKIPLDLL